LSETAAKQFHYVKGYVSQPDVQWV